MRIAIIVCLFLCQTALFGQVRIIKFNELKQRMDAPGEQIQVFNFWATWCGPCIKELPYFQALHDKNRPDVKITLINLDFADKADKVSSFVKRKNIKAEVLLLDELDYNSWIDKVDKSWEGAIPATLIINSKTGKRKFVAKELKEGELEALINDVL
jgi:thiol-disulfide isomerase/thioredoxin